MRDQELLDLQEAYMEVCQYNENTDTEDLTEAGMRYFPSSSRPPERIIGRFKSIGRNSTTNPAEDGPYRGGKELDSPVYLTKQPANTETPENTSSTRSPRGKKRTTKLSKVRLVDMYNYYDTVLSYLLDEGYAETPEAAEAIMVNMSEDWREEIIDEAWREPKRRNDPTPSGRAVHRHLDKSGSTRNPSPANLARRETQARRLENRADNIEKTKDFADAYHRTGLWKNTPKENAPKFNSKGKETSSNLRSRAKAIRAVTRAQTRRSSTDVDNQRIANSVQTQAYKNAIARVNVDSGNRETPKANFDRATSHLDLSKVDSDTYGKPRRTTPKSPKKAKTQSNRSPKPKQIAKNNIRQFNREELECIFHYILTEGYCSTEEDAIFMMENMSDEWKTNILNSI